MRNTTYHLLVGKLQSGKTTTAIKYFNKYLQEGECLPIFCTHNSENVFCDLQSKLNPNYTYYDPREGTSKVLFSNGQRAGKTTSWAKFLKNIMTYGTVDDGHGIVGLNNRYFHEKIAPAIINYHHKKVIFVDEYDNSQIGFTTKRQAVQRDRWLYSYEVENVIDEMVLLSATNLSAAISNKTFDPACIEVIKPGKGYQGWGKNINRQYLNDSDFKALREGRPRGAVFDIAEDASGHVMVNIETHIDVHNAIANCFQEAGFKTMVVNSEAAFDFEALKGRQKIVLIGGSMFDRGQTFHGLSTLIIDRPEIHQASLLQAVGRLFGYKDYQLTLAASGDMFERINDCFEIETQISKQEVLSMPVEERWKWLGSNVIFNSKRVLSPKSNGWREGVRRLGAAQVPHMRLSTEPLNDKQITKIQSKIYTDEGTPRSMVFGEWKHVGTSRWGSRSPEKMASDFVDQHPQGRTIAEKTAAGRTRRKIIVPPWSETHVDGDRQWTEWDFNDPATCGWYIDNSMEPQERESIKTPYVASVAASGEWLIWHNLNLLDEEDWHEEARGLISPIK